MITPLQYQEMQARLNRNPIRDSKCVEGSEDESELHQQILKECALRGFLVWRERMDKRSQQKQGTPDFCILMDKSRVAIIECKSKTGKCTTEQLGWIMQAERIGHTVHVIRSYNEFLRLCQ